MENPNKKLNVVKNASSATFICEVCKRKYPNATALRIHVTKHSTTRSQNSRIDPLFKEKENEAMRKKMRKNRVEPAFKEKENEAMTKKRIDPAFKEKEKEMNKKQKKEKRQDPHYKKSEWLRQKNYYAFFKLRLITSTNQAST